MSAGLPSLLANRGPGSTSFAPRYQGEPVERKGLGEVIHATRLSPPLGDWQVDHYERGRPVMVPTDTNLAKRMGQLTGLALLYGAMAQHTWHEPLWEATLPAWAAVLAFSEGRTANDQLGQVQNTVQAALPILIGGYIGVPAAQWAKQQLQQHENTQLFELLSHPYHEHWAQQLVRQDEAPQRQAIARYQTELKRPQPLSQQTDTRLALLEAEDALTQKVKANKAFTTTLADLQQALTQDNLHQLPRYLDGINRLQVALVSDATPHLSAVQKNDTINTLKAAAQYLSKAHQDERTTGGFFSLPEAIRLGQRLREVHTWLQADTSPPAMRAQADTALEPLHRLLAPPNPVVRRWFSPLQLSDRLERLEDLKAKLNMHLQRFDRPIVERTLAELETQPIIKNANLEHWQQASQQLVGQFKQTVQHLKSTQYPINTTLKTLAPLVGMVTMGAFVGNRVARGFNQWLATVLPKQAATSTDHLPDDHNSVASRLNAGFIKAIHHAAPSLENIPLELPDHYHYSSVPVSWTNIEDTSRPIDYKAVSLSS
jgi:hypothetical protein